MESKHFNPGCLDPHYLDLKDTVQLPPERHLHEEPSISAIAALDATSAAAKNAIICANPTLAELMDNFDDNEDVHMHLVSAHNIVDIIDRLRLSIHTYYRQIEEHIRNRKFRDLPF